MKENLPSYNLTGLSSQNLYVSKYISIMLKEQVTIQENGDLQAIWDRFFYLI